MNSQDFENLRETFLSKEAEVFDWKRGEYGDDEDKLLNFKQIANFTGVYPSEVCMIHMLKHIQSLALAIKNGKHKDKWFWHDEKGNEGLKQRIVDIRNYALLLAACIEDEIDKGQSTANHFRGGEYLS